MGEGETGTMTANDYLRMIQDRRRFHLRKLVAKLGSQIAVEMAAGMRKGHISQYLLGKRRITEDSARRIEQHNGLALGSMDGETV